ncbi:MAG TPA: hypothetical protein PLD88_10590, partial [Candidatus Berkiella sp.]|nr:hypothetical protein [Candidatus Berkiella sp.]
QRSLARTAADLMDRINGYADEETTEQYNDSWLTQNINTIPSLVINQFRGLTQRFWSQPATQPTHSPDVENRATPRTPN